MALSYPLTPPPSPVPSRVMVAAEDTVAANVSPFTRFEQAYAWAGDQWEMQLSLPSMDDADARDWVAFLLGLYGIEGYFLMEDPSYSGKRGTWSSASPTPVVNGAHAAGARTIALKNLTSGATAKAGDEIQFGTGSTSRLHRVVQDAVAAAGGGMSIEIWPRLREPLADGAFYVIDSPVGLWRLKENRREWSVEELRDHGISFGICELLRD